MKIKNSWRIPLGFLLSIWFIWVAEPTALSLLIGVLVMILGECIRFVSAGTIVKAREVTRAGIYTYTRNPLYIGSFLLGTGACIIGRDLWFSAVFFCSFILFYRMVIRNEERFLLNRFGEDYQRYLAEVPRFLPRKIRITPALCAVSVSHALRNKEGKTLLGIVFIVGVMLLKLKYPF
jgi:protein-S-isoprenylcysteine O-methyltransferase Ste14